MTTVELQISPKALLEVFEAKSIGTGMSCEVPGHGVIEVRGMRKDEPSHLIPVVLRLWSGAGVEVFSSWLCDKLERANARHIQVEGVEIKATAKAIAKAISECIDLESKFVATDDGSEKPLLPVLAVPEQEIVSSRGAIVCLRIKAGMDKEEYVEGSTIQKCSVCQSDVLAAPSTQRILEYGENQIVCMECWMEANPAEGALEDG